MNTPHLDTDLIHFGIDRAEHGGALQTPIFQSSTWTCEGQSSYHELRYLRLNNSPNHTTLARRLARFECGEAALVAASGMAAITAALLTELKSGDHLIAQRGLYGGTYSFCADLMPRFGIECDFVEGDDPAQWRAALRPNTRGFYCETMTNPTVRVADLPAISAFCREHDLVSFIDNTFASPVLYRPIEHGFDLVLHSATKYLNGHADLVAGAVVGSAARIENITKMLNHLGGSLDPHACFLLERGLKTLSLRVERQSATARAVAELLDQHPAVERVNYPSCEDHPDHARAGEILPNGFGGMLSFEVRGGGAAANTVMNALEIPVLAPSLGGVESLVIRPAETTNFLMSDEEKARSGITEGLIRLSVGIEAEQDLLQDLEQALGKV